MVQDARYRLAFPNRGSALDLLDNNPTRSCTISCKGNCPADPVTKKAPPQLDTCINEFLVDQLAPDVHCTDQGVCTDPLKVPPTGIPVPLSGVTLGGKPDMRDPGGGIAIRLVFDKVLDNSIEMVTMDPTKAPGSTNTYTIVPGIVELHDAADKVVKSVVYYDNGGSFQYSADLELVPLGPAIVIKPTVTLDAATKYTVKILNAGAIKDREGNAATALGGGALPASISFTTEDLTPAASGNFGTSPLDYPDFSMAATIAPDEVIQIGFFEAYQGDAAKVTVKSGCTGAHPVAYTDRGNDKTMCTKSDPGGIPAAPLDIYNGTTSDVTTALPAPMGWPIGDCTLTITVPDAAGKSMYTADYTFTVMTPAMTDPMNPNIESQHVMPAECMMP